jgi:uncharacterized OB-fold protein
MPNVLKPQPMGIPVGAPSALAQPYWDACRRGELVYQRCDDCGLILERPSTVCGACFGRSLGWARSSGQGELYSWTVVWRPQHPAFEVPYAPAIVAMDEGWWHIAAVVGCEPEDLTAGMRLAVEFHPATDDITLPYYRPA